MATITTVLNGVPVRVTYFVDFSLFEGVSPNEPTHVRMMEGLAAAALQGDLQSAIAIQQQMRPLRHAAKAGE